MTKLVLLRSVFRVRLLARQTGEASFLVLPESVFVREGVSATANVFPRFVLLSVLAKISIIFETFAAFFANVITRFTGKGM